MSKKLYYSWDVLVNISWKVKMSMFGIGFDKKACVLFWLIIMYQALDLQVNALFACDLLVT